MSLYFPGFTSEVFSHAARVAFPYIKSLVDQNVSANAIQRELSRAKMGVRRQELLRAVRGYRDYLDSRKYIRAVNNTKLPNPDRFARAITPLVRQYAYVVRVDGIHPVTGERINQWITISSDELMTKNQAYDQAQQYILADPSSYPIEVQGMVVDTALRASERL